MSKTQSPDFSKSQPNTLLRALLGVDAFDGPHRVSGIRRKIAKRYLRWTGFTYDIEFRGLKLRLHPSHNADDLWLVMHGVHPEDDELKLFCEEISKHNLFVDIGGNMGIYSLLADKRMKGEARIICFEPDPDAAHRLETNLQLNAADRVELVKSALGPQRGELKLHRVNVFNAGENTARAGLSKYSYQKPLTVPVLPLHEALVELQALPIGLMKVDVEGFEDQIIVPFFKICPATQWPKYIMLETCHREHWDTDVMEFLSHRGFKEVFRNKSNAHFQRQH